MDTIVAYPDERHRNHYTGRQTKNDTFSKDNEMLDVEYRSATTLNIILAIVYFNVVGELVTSLRSHEVHNQVLCDRPQPNKGSGEVIR